MTHTPHPPAPAFGQSFTPVPVRPRHDGWTPARQVQFIEALAACGCVSEAAARVQMSRASAYMLYQHEEAAAFRSAWDTALNVAVRQLSDAAFARALNGVPVPHFYKGQLIYESRRYDEVLTRFLLQHLEARTKSFDDDASVYNPVEEDIAAHADAMRELLAPPVAEALAPPAESLSATVLESEPGAQPDGVSDDEISEAELDRIWRENVAEYDSLTGGGSSSLSTYERWSRDIE